VVSASWQLSFRIPGATPEHTVRPTELTSISFAFRFWAKASDPASERQLRQLRPNAVFFGNGLHLVLYSVLERGCKGGNGVSHLLPES
jgi:hypothetical protein